MKLYDEVLTGSFIRRPNRFIAHVQTENGVEICHVKNTGRCAELLTPGAAVTLAVGKNPGRKTRCDLVAVQKGDPDNLLPGINATIAKLLGEGAIDKFAEEADAVSDLAIE